MKQYYLGLLLAAICTACCPLEDSDIYCYAPASVSVPSHEMIDEALVRVVEGTLGESPQLDYVIERNAPDLTPGKVKMLTEGGLMISLRAKNFTPGKKVFLFERDPLCYIDYDVFGYVSDTGIVLFKEGNPILLEYYKLVLNECFPSEWKDFILVTEDQTEIAVTRFVARPVKAVDRFGRSVKVNLGYVTVDPVDGVGWSYTFLLDGFQPNEEVQFISERVGDGQVLENTIICNEEGKAASLVLPASEGKVGGVLKVTIDGDNLEEAIRITLGWGSELIHDAEVSPLRG